MLKVDTFEFFGETWDHGIHTHAGYAFHGPQSLLFLTSITQSIYNFTDGGRQGPIMIFDMSEYKLIHYYFQITYPNITLFILIFNLHICTVHVSSLFLHSFAYHSIIL